MTIGGRQGRQNRGGRDSGWKPVVKDRAKRLAGMQVRGDCGRDTVGGRHLQEECGGREGSTSLENRNARVRHPLLLLTSPPFFTQETRNRWCLGVTKLRR